MDRRNALTLLACRIHSRRDMAVRPAPTDDQQIALCVAMNSLDWDVVGDAGNLRGARANHVLMVRGVVTDVSGDVLLLDAADTVFQTGCAGQRPRPHQS